MHKSLEHEQRGVLKLERELLAAGATIAALSASTAKAQSLLGADVVAQTDKVMSAYLNLVELVQNTHTLMNERAIAAGVTLMQQAGGAPKDPPLEMAKRILGL